jgi:hypothetical protein
LDIVTSVNMVLMLELGEPNLHLEALNATAENNRAIARLVLQDHPENLDCPVTMAPLERPETLDWPELKFTHNIKKKAASNVKLDPLDLLDLMAHPDPLEKMEIQEPMVNQERQVNKALQGQLVMQEPQELTEPQADQDNPAKTGNVIAQSQDQKDQMDPQDHQDKPAQLESNLNQEHPGPLDHQEAQAHQETKGATEKLAQADNLELQVPMPLTALAHLAHKISQSKHQKLLAAIANVVFERIFKRIK